MFSLKSEICNHSPNNLELQKYLKKFSANPTFDLADNLDLFDSGVYCTFTNSTNSTGRYVDLLFSGGQDYAGIQCVPQ